MKKTIIPYNKTGINKKARHGNETEHHTLSTPSCNDSCKNANAKKVRKRHQTKNRKKANTNTQNKTRKIKQSCGEIKDYFKAGGQGQLE